MTLRSVVDAAWAAGLFEGEGCFTFTAGRPVACLNTTDEDVIRRFQSIVGGNLNGPYDKGGKPIWSWAITGQKSVEPFYRLLSEHLGERRRARGAEVLAMYEALLFERANRSKYPRTCRNGHAVNSPDDEAVIGHKRPQCRICYRAQKTREASK